jgi:uncharacterized protein (TIGR03066 family)
MEFAKDGKIKVQNGNSEVISEGTYKVDADKLAITMKDAEGKDRKVSIASIKSLTADTFILITSSGKETTLKKK